MARRDESVKITRRDLLRRGAVVGGTLVWATPVIQSMGAPAHAQGYPCQPGCFWVKIDRDGACEDANGTVFCPNCLGGRPQDLGGCCWAAGRVVFHPENGGGATLTLPPGCTFLGGFSKCGAGFDCRPAEPTPGGAEFHPCLDERGGESHDVSHVEFCFCCS